MDLEVTGLSIDGAPGNGVTLSGENLTASIQYADIDNVDNLGLSSDEATLTVSDSAISGAGTSGVELLSGSGLTFSNNTISSSAEYGLICGDVDIVDCTGNSYSKNATADTLSCPSECE